MAARTLDHERLDVDRTLIEYVALAYRITKSRSGAHRPARDQWMLAGQPIPLYIAEGNGKQSLKDKNRFLETARVDAHSVDPAIRVRIRGFHRVRVQ